MLVHYSYISSKPALISIMLDFSAGYAGQSSDKIFFLVKPEALGELNT